MRARVARERRARHEAEAIAEGATRDLYERQRELELLGAVAAAANSAADVDEALAVAVEGVCEHTGWPVGHVFFVDDLAGDELRSSGIWHMDDPERFDALRQVTAETHLARGIGLPGRIFETGRPAWIPDVRVDSNFPRAQTALDLGIGAAFGFPVLVGESVAAILEFFSPSTADPDDRLLELVAHIGTQLGRVVERDRLGRELERNSEELEAANDDLREFAYVTSHDLSEPLRTISGFVQLLASRYQGQLDSDADDFIGFVVDGTERMQALIDSLLSYSRAGRVELAYELVDCGELVKRTLQALGASLEESGGEVEVGPLPIVRADPIQLERLFHNLLSNALKFRAHDSPRVRISADRTEAGFEFSVEDNGIGIEPRHSERVFGVFQRLHGPGEYPGTGVGLSICRRVVERHGGRIWILPATSGGTAVRFNLPAAPEGE